MKRTPLCNCILTWLNTNYKGANFEIDSIRCIFLIGSRIYGTFKPSSDYDLRVVLECDFEISSHDVELIFEDTEADEIKQLNICFFTIEKFETLLFCNDIDTLQALYGYQICQKQQSPYCSFLLDNLGIASSENLNMVLDFKRVRRSCLQQAARCWKKFGLMFASREVSIGKKNIGHALRLLLLGKQVIVQGGIEDFSCANPYHNEIIQSEMTSVKEYSERWYPVYKLFLEDLCTAFDDRLQKAQLLDISKTSLPSDSSWISNSKKIRLGNDISQIPKKLLSMDIIPVGPYSVLWNSPLSPVSESTFCFSMCGAIVSESEVSFPGTPNCIDASDRVFWKKKHYHEKGPFVSSPLLESTQCLLFFDHHQAQWVVTFEPIYANLFLSSHSTLLPFLHESSVSQTENPIKTIQDDCKNDQHSHPFKEPHDRKKMNQNHGIRGKYLNPFLRQQEKLRAKFWLLWEKQNHSLPSHEYEGYSFLFEMKCSESQIIFKPAKVEEQLLFSGFCQPGKAYVTQLSEETQNLGCKVLGWHTIPLLVEEKSLPDYIFWSHRFNFLEEKGKLLKNPQNQQIKVHSPAYISLLNLLWFERVDALFHQKDQNCIPLVLDDILQTLQCNPAQNPFVQLEGFNPHYLLIWEELQKQFMETLSAIQNTFVTEFQNQGLNREQAAVKAKKFPYPKILMAMYHSKADPYESLKDADFKTFKSFFKIKG